MAELKSATVHFQLPLWVIGPPSAKIKGLARGTDPDGVNGVLLFTDKNLAQQFLDADSRLAGNVLWAVLDPWHLFGLLVFLEKAGVANVVSDPNPMACAVLVAGLRAYAEQLVL